MNFPRKIPKPAKRSSRFKSQAHLAHVRQHACANCGFAPAPPGKNQAAHVRMLGDAGMGQKDDDWLTVPLCDGCHNEQHRKGEPTFWKVYATLKGHDVEALIQHMIRTSPRRAQIEQHIREHS